MSPADNRVRVDFSDFGRGRSGDRARYHSHEDPCREAPRESEARLMPLVDAEQKAVLDPCDCAPRLEGPTTVSNNPKEWSA